MTPPLCHWLGMNIAITTRLKRACADLPPFRAVNSIYSQNAFVVAMFAVPGGVYMLESVFLLNAEVFGVSDSLGEKISVGNVELILLRTGPRLAYDGHRVHRSMLEVWKARLRLA